MMTHIPTNKSTTSNNHHETTVPQPPPLLFNSNTSYKMMSSSSTNNQIVPHKLQKKQEAKSRKLKEEQLMTSNNQSHYDIALLKQVINPTFEPNTSTTTTLNLSPATSSSTNNSNQLSDAESSLSDESSNSFPSNIMGSPSSSSDGKKVSSTNLVSRKPIRTIVNNNGRPRNNSAASSSSTATRKISSSPASASAVNSLIRNQHVHQQPTLGFSNDFSVSGGTPSFVFTCKEGFIQNDSKKAPPDTFFNVTIRDSIAISSEIFNKCTCILKLKDGSPEGISVSTETFKPSNSNNSTTFECTITIPQKITTIKGSSSSRIGYIEIYNHKEECIAVSSFFWIRSRSRLQLDKDTKRKQISEPSSTAAVSATTASTTTLNSNGESKRKREHTTTDTNEGITEESEKKVVKLEDENGSTISSMVHQQPQQPFHHQPVNTNTLPPFSSLYAPSSTVFSTGVHHLEQQPQSNIVDMLFFEINSLRQQVALQQDQIRYLMDRK